MQGEVFKIYDLKTKEVLAAKFYRTKDEEHILLVYYFKLSIFNKSKSIKI